MTKQITIKLNHELFRPILDHMQSCCKGLITSDSDLVAKSIYFVYSYLNIPTKIGKTRFDIVVDALGVNKTEGLVDYFKDYYEFKKKGLKKK